MNNPLLQGDIVISDHLLENVLQTWIEGGIIYGQLWDYLQRELDKFQHAMESEVDSEGVNHYQIYSMDKITEYNSEIEMVIAAIEALIEHKVSP